MFEFLNRIKYFFARVEQLKELEEENTYLKESVLKSVDLVSSYKLAMTEMQKFVNEVGNIAEAQGHHPDIIFGWGYAKVQIFTHKIKGLVESDFILAAKVDKITI